MRYNLSASEWTGHTPELGQMVIVGNVYQAGPSTMLDVPMLRVTGVGMVEVYLADNIAKTMAGEDAVAIGGVSAANAMQVADAAAVAGRLHGDARGGRQGFDPRQRRRAPVGPRRDRHAHRRPGAERRRRDHRQRGGRRRLSGRDAHAGAFVDDEWDLRFMVRKSGTP